MTDRDRSSGGARGEDAGDALPVEEQRAALGFRLFRLRQAAHLTQKQLGAAIGVQQPLISGFESGREVPGTATLARLADALRLSAEVRQELEDQAAALRVEVRTARWLVRQGPRITQRRIAAEEAAAAEVWSYHVSLIPGLLQTPDYIRAMCVVLDPHQPVDVEVHVTAREKRQHVLLDPRHRFRFVMAEAAVRTRIAPLDVHRAQLRRLLALAEGFAHVAIGVIPASRPLSAWTLAGFDLIGDVVHVETAVGEVLYRAPEDVEAYRGLFDLLDAQAVHGADLADLLRTVDADLLALAE